MIRYHITLYGQVQEVGFRFFVYHASVKLELTGWVRNCCDDSVELEVQGEDKAVDDFIGELIKGNGFSRIENMDSKVIDVKESEKTFRITY